MNWKSRTTRNVIYVLLAFLLMGANAPAQVYQAKVDNFIFLYDATSSMDEVYQKQAQRRSILAREAMQQINENIPDLGFVSGLYTIVPSIKTHQGLNTHNTDKFAFAISQTQLPARHIGPQTPLSEGLAQLGPILENLSGTTAILLFTDGGENRGGSPTDIMEELYLQYDVCFHFISYAHTEAEKEVMKRMRTVEDCSYSINGEAVQDPQARKQFVKNIFYERIKDSDGDGVPDYLDKCPDTPKDLVVDEFGCPVPMRITLNIKFDFDKAKIKSKYQDELKKVADFMKERPEVDVVVEGHTDAIGTDEYNQKLSQRRASSVKEYLVETFHISADRITTKAYGESRPIADNDTPTGRQKNRRVEGVFPKVFQKK